MQQQAVNFGMKLQTFKQKLQKKINEYKAEERRGGGNGILLTLIVPSLTENGIVTTPYTPGVPYKQHMKSDK